MCVTQPLYANDYPIDAHLILVELNLNTSNKVSSLKAYPNDENACINEEEKYVKVFDVEVLLIEVFDTPPIYFTSFCFPKRS